MKTNKTPTAKPARTTRTAKVKAETTTTAKSASALAAPKIKGSKTPAAKKPKAAAPLTSPRVTKAAANAKKALTLSPEVPQTPKPAAPKKTIKATAKPKPARPASGAREQSTKAVPALKAAARPSAVEQTTTTIEAFIDVGFGNRLTLRGEGAGLSWERGLTLNCLGSAEWVIALEGAQAPLTFKFLLNDEQWSLGENYTLAPGKTGAFTPEF